MFLSALAMPCGVMMIRLVRRLVRTSDTEERVSIGIQFIWFFAILVFVLVSRDFVWESYIDPLFS